MTAAMPRRLAGFRNPFAALRRRAAPGVPSRLAGSVRDEVELIARHAEMLARYGEAPPAPPALPDDLAKCA
jgi:hypothetical protein